MAEVDVTSLDPPFPPPRSKPSSFPFLEFHYQVGVPSSTAGKTTLVSVTDSQPRVQEKMEHRDADFNILLATDSYKVPYQ